MKSFKSFLILLSGILFSGWVLSCGSKNVVNEPSAAVECKAIPIKSLKVSGETSLNVIKDHCGKETEILLLQVNSPKITPQLAEDQAMSVYVDNVCETFADTLFIRKNMVIGCCPEPIPTENGKKRERVFFAKFDDNGKFDTHELLSVLNTYTKSPTKKDAPAVAASCSSKNIKIDYEKTKKAQKTL